MARKTRSDSKLDKLPDNQRDMLIRWFVEEKLSYDDARDRLLNDFNVSTSNDALSRFWRKHCFRQQASKAKATADDVLKTLKGSSQSFDEATLKLIHQRAFEIAYAQDGNLDDLSTLAKIIGDSHKLALKREQLEHAREKFRQQIKSDVEHGLDALFEEIKGNAKATALFDKLKASVLQSVEGAG